MIPASHAIRRASPAVMAWPVSRYAGWSVSPVKSEYVMVTVTVAAIPPAFGVRSVG